MKDRYTGKSRGFGFVTFVFSADAVGVAAMEHHVDGRRCEAKFALPRGGETGCSAPSILHKARTSGTSSRIRA